MNSEPLVYVIVINYNGLKYLKTCLSSLEHQTYKNYKTIVMDNASTDKSVQYITQIFPKVHVIHAERNLGFAEGNNLAMQFALNQNADCVFLVNNDTALEEDLIRKLVATIDSDDSIGIAGPAVFDLKNRQSLQEMGMATDKFGYPLALKTGSEKNCVFFVSGCAMLIKSAILRKIGFFDEAYFMFAEDLDLCWRAQLAGYKVTVDETTKIYHASGGSISGGVTDGSTYKTNVKRVFLREKNTLRTLIKNYDSVNMIQVVPFYVALLLVESVLWTFILKPMTSKNILKAILWNLFFFSDTLKRRVVVQGLRKISDDQITLKMSKGFNKLRIFRAIGVPDFE